MNDAELLSILKNLKVNESKSNEAIKNERIKHCIDLLFSNGFKNRLCYIFATKLPRDHSLKDEDIIYIGSLINKEIILHEKHLQGAMDFITNKNCCTGMEEFILKYHKTDSEIKEIINNKITSGKNKKEIFKTINQIEELKYINSAIINNLVDQMLLESKDDHKIAKESIVVEKPNIIEDEFAWLKEGELSKIHTPDSNPLNNKEKLDEHLKRTGGKVITRFPPEPNGYLHIGHAKALNLSYNFSKMHGGEFNMRFDDTNPRNEKEVYKEQILSDVKWLLGSETPFDRITHASDHFDTFIKHGFKLIEDNKAYICNLTKDEMKLYKDLQQDSPYRNRSRCLNKVLFQEMVEGKWKEGTIALRLKQDMSSKNHLMHDMIAFRVIDVEKTPHYKTGKKYHVYPSYDYVHCINDSIEDITHSFCSREFFHRRESYYWVLSALDLYKPVQWEFSRLKIKDVLLSKRKILEAVEKKQVNGWDDPRLYTLCALRRRGFTNTGINKFVKSIGITFNDSLIDINLLENTIIEDLDLISKRISCVINPISVLIYNDNVIEKEVWIERTDFSDLNDPNFLRFTKSQAVGLMKYSAIEYLRREGDNIIARKTTIKPKKFIHWVDKGCAEEIEVRFYDKLYNSDGEYNENSLEIKKCFCDKEIKNSQIEDKFQFIRIGYFCVDKDSTNEKKVVNFTLPLKNKTW